VPADWQPPPQPKQPSPDELLAQVEITKAQANARKDAVEARDKTLAAIMEDDRLRDEARVNALLQAAELHGKYGLHVDLAALSNMMQRDPELSVALVSIATGAPGALPPGVGGMPPDDPGAPMLQAPTQDAGMGAPAAPTIGDRGGQQQQGQSLGDARVFLPPQLIQALAAMRRANAAAPAPGAP
jgi:hypothetical protein